MGSAYNTVMSSPYVVAVVVCVDFAEQLDELANRMPVWIADTPPNRAAAKKVWAAHPGQTHLNGVTTFKVDASSTAEVWLASILADVDLHHGSHSHDPPYSAVEIFGAQLTLHLRRAFEEFGLTTFVERPGGFVATRTPAAV